MEDVRKNVVEKYGFDKVYKQGFNIKSPLNLKFQKIATKALRKGLLDYDKRKGWRGALTNKKKFKNWHNDKNLKKFKLDKSLNWELAIVKKINQFSVDIETEKKLIGKINYETTKWKKKELNQLLRIGDIIYVKKNDKNIYLCKFIHLFVTKQSNIKKKGKKFDY